MKTLNIFCVKCANKSEEKLKFFYDIMQDKIYCKSCIDKLNDNEAHYYSYIETISLKDAIDKVINISYKAKDFRTFTTKFELETDKFSNSFFYEKNNTIKVHFIINNNIHDIDLFNLFDDELDENDDNNKNKNNKNDITFLDCLKNNYDYVSDIKDYFQKFEEKENIYLISYYFNFIYQYIFLCYFSFKQPLVSETNLNHDQSVEFKNLIKNNFQKFFIKFKKLKIEDLIKKYILDTKEK